MKQPLLTDPLASTKDYLANAFNNQIAHQKELLPTVLKQPTVQPRRTLTSYKTNTTAIGKYYSLVVKKDSKHRQHPAW